MLKIIILIFKKLDYQYYTFLMKLLLLGIKNNNIVFKYLQDK